MKLTEAQTQAAFVTYLIERGWDVDTENADHTDVIAHRGAEALIAEVKGHTSSPGLDVDTLYGQLLRRMRPGDEVTYAVVVPASVGVAAGRVPAAVRQSLLIDIYEVAADGSVLRREDES